MSQYKIYAILHEFATKWRGFKQVSNMLSNELFDKHMNSNNLINIPFIDTSNKKRIQIILLCEGNIIKTDDLKKIFNKMNKEQAQVMIILEKYLRDASVDQLAESYPNLEIKYYLHKNFVTIIPEYSLCSKHTILSPEEANRVLIDLATELHLLQKIHDNDPQIIWIGAKEGDIVQLESKSQITGSAIHYRVVVKSAKVKA